MDVCWIFIGLRLDTCSVDAFWIFVGLKFDIFLDGCSLVVRRIEVRYSSMHDRRILAGRRSDTFSMDVRWMLSD